MDRQPTLAELDRRDLEHQFAFGTGMQQVLARAELQRRVVGEQRSLLTPMDHARLQARR